jgi:hypothetical protein
MTQHRHAYLLVAALAACGGGSGLDVHDYFARLHEARCRGQVACKEYPDLASCLATSWDPLASRQHDAVAAGVDAGKIHFNADAAQRCLDGLPAVCQLTGDQPSPVEAACLEAFTGAVPEGSPCFLDEECVEGSAGACVPPASCPANTCCAGTCAGVVVLQTPIGAACSSPNYRECVVGAYCETTNLCTAALPAGAACPSARPGICATGYCFNNVCVTPAASGATCDPANSGVACSDFAEVCDPQRLKCIPLRAVGETCSRQSQVAACVTLAICGSAGTCVARGKPGDACDPTVSQACLDGAACDTATKTCMVPTALPPLTCL